MSQLDTLLKMLWQDYSTMNPQAKKIHEALEARGEQVLNDHVAFRTFDLPKVSIEVLVEPFLKEGYVLKNDSYTFKEKKLFAKHYEHSDASRPKIFISALKLKECSKELQNTVQKLVEQIPDHFGGVKEMLIAGSLWKKVEWKTYQELLGESEYAAWMSAFGFRVNHFTVFANTLKSFKSLQDLNEFIKGLGFPLNASGGEIKGSKELLLEQSSTLASPVMVDFKDCKEVIPGCYYEFAKRYLLPDGKLFHGFLPESADKIFESTNVKPKT